MLSGGDALIQISAETTQLIIQKNERAKMREELVHMLIGLDKIASRSSFSMERMRRKYPTVCDLIDELK